jgi:hypothetical protein
VITDGDTSGQARYRLAAAIRLANSFSNGITRARATGTTLSPELCSKCHGTLILSAQWRLSKESAINHRTGAQG